MQLHLLTGMPDGDSGWKAKCTRGCPSFRRRLYYVWATFITKKTIIFYHLLIDISVNNPAYHFIFLCQDVEVISMYMGGAEKVGLTCDPKHIKCPSPPTFSI